VAGRPVDQAGESRAVFGPNWVIACGTVLSADSRRPLKNSSGRCELDLVGCRPARQRVGRGRALQYPGAARPSWMAGLECAVPAVGQVPVRSVAAYFFQGRSIRIG